MTDDPTDEPGPLDDAVDEPGTDADEPDLFDDEDEDLWGTDDAERQPVNRNLIVGVVAVVALLVIGFIVFGGGDDGGDDKVATGDQPAAQGGKDATTQITSQVAPYNAKDITPTTLPPGAVPHGCGDWDSAFNYPPKEMTDGVYIWSDFKGWHIRVAGDSLGPVTGSVLGQYAPPVAGIPSEGTEAKTDEVGKRITFTIAPGADPTGFDFSAGCKQKELTFELAAGGAAVPVDKISLGDRGIVKEYPLVARRTLPRPG